MIKINATARLKATEEIEAAMSNSQGGIMDEVVRQLKAGKYQIKISGTTIQVEGTIANVVGAMRYKGWTFNKAKSELTHPQVDYYIKLSESNGVTTVRVLD